MIPIIQIGQLQIPSFFLVISLSLSFLLYFLSYRVDHLKKNRKIAFDMALILMASSLLGGRLMHVFYEEWDFYKADPILILYFWNGGFVFYGGLILCFLAGFLYTKIKNISLSEWADFFTPLFSLGHAFGRIGCFLSGCCFGSQCALPWSLAGRHPTALYLAGGEFLIFLLLLVFEKKKVFKFSGGFFAFWLFLHSTLRFNVEFYRDDFRGVFVELPLFGHLSISQVISGIIIFICIAWFSLKLSSAKTNQLS